LYKESKHVFYFQWILSKKRAVYEIICKKHKIHCCVSTATVLRESATLLRPTYVACLVFFKHWELANRKLGGSEYNIDLPTTEFCRAGKRCHFYITVPVLNCSHIYAEFLGAFAKLKNVTISFIMPVSPSVLPCVLPAT